MEDMYVETAIVAPSGRPLGRALVTAAQMYHVDSFSFIRMTVGSHHGINHGKLQQRTGEGCDK